VYVIVIFVCRISISDSPSTNAWLWLSVFHDHESVKLIECFLARGLGLLSMQIAWQFMLRVRTWDGAWQRC